MTLTREQFQQLRNKGLSVEQITQFEKGNAPQTPRQGVSGAAGGLTVGLAKEAGSFAVGGASLLQKLGQGIMATPSLLPGGKTFSERFKEIRGSTGFDSLERDTEAGQRIEEKLSPIGGAEKLGSGIGKVGTFFAPAGAITRGAQVASKLAQGTRIGSAAPRTAGLATTAGVEGAGFGGIDLISSGGDFDDAKATALFSAAFPIVGSGLKAVRSALGNKIPERIVEGLVKQTPLEKQKKDIVPFLVQKGTIGSVDKLIKETDSAMNKLNQDIQSRLVKASKGGTGISVNIQSVFDDVASKLNSEGAEITAQEVKNTVIRLAPQVKRLLDEGDTVLTSANKLRTGVDKTIGDRAFLQDQLPFNKELLMSFANSLRNKIKDSAPGTRDLFEEFSKEITLKNALVKRASSGQGGNAFGLLDILAAGLGGTVGGVPGAAAGLAARKVAESPVTRTATANLLSKQLPRVQRLFESASDIERAAMLSILEAMESDQ